MKNTGILLKLAGTSLIWALIFFWGKVALESWSALSLGAWRFLIAAVCIVPATVLTEKIERSLLFQNLVPLVLMALIGITFFNGFLFHGIANTSPVNASLIMAICPALVAVLSSCWQKTQLTKFQFLGLSLSLSGVCMIILNDQASGFGNLSLRRGDASVLLACACWAIYSCIPIKYIHGMSAFQIAAVTISIGAMFNLIVAGLFVQDLFVIPSAESFLALLGLSIFGVVVAFVWWQQGLRVIGSEKAAIFMNLVPPLTMLVGASLGQSINGVQLVGCALVLGGVWATVRMKK